MDALLEMDWAAHWTSLVLSRAAALGERDQGFWDGVAQSRADRRLTQADPLLDVLEPYLKPSRTLIDVGGGGGRYAAPLSKRLDWVTVVEPSLRMRERLPDLDNLTVIASNWQEAETQPASLVLCSHVLYWIAASVLFVEKLEAAASERVFVVLRDGPHPHPAEAMAGHVLPREPRLEDAFALLRQMGRTPDVVYWREKRVYRFPDLEAAVENCRRYLGRHWDEEKGADWLTVNLRRDSDGMLAYHAPESVTGVLHWSL
jgi:Methyltransferase domain